MKSLRVSNGMCSFSNLGVLVLILVIAVASGSGCGSSDSSGSGSSIDSEPESFLVDCTTGSEPEGGDGITRSFYFPDYPGSTLDRVDLFFDGGGAGTARIQLDVREGTFDGPIIGTATVDSNVGETTFEFESAPVTPGQTLAFSMELVSGTGPIVYSVACGIDEDCAAQCPVVQTNGTTPPLDSFRRDAVSVRIFGSRDAGEANPQTFDQGFGWSCTNQEDCQDVFDLDLMSGSVVTFQATQTTGGSVVQIALYGPGVALGGTNLLTGDMSELRCYPGGDCTGNPEGVTAADVVISASGTYRFAVTRHHGNSCGSSGTYRIIIDSDMAFSEVTQTVDDVATLAEGFSCP